jgi:hypothetical protein
MASNGQGQATYLMLNEFNYFKCEAGRDGPMHVVVKSQEEK